MQTAGPWMSKASGGCSSLFSSALRRRLSRRRLQHCAAKEALDVLPGREDHYDGFIIDHQQLPTDPGMFSRRLMHSLGEWRARSKRGIWLKLDLSQAGLMQSAMAAGFDYHHAAKGYAMLTKWLPSTQDKLPLGATHQVGVGAFVVREVDKHHGREVLLVQESHGIHRNKGIWKLPTGLAAQAEDVPSAAEREVFEETGISTIFDKVLAIRQAHHMHVSDLFFVCGMRLAPGRQDIVIQEDELAAVAWHPLEEAERLPIFVSGPIFRTIFSCCKAYADGLKPGMEANKLENGFNPQADLLIH